MVHRRSIQSGVDRGFSWGDEGSKGPQETRNLIRPPSLPLSRKKDVCDWVETGVCGISDWDFSVDVRDCLPFPSKKRGASP